ncbi:N,N'-diacetylchitobiose phosphorylase [Aquisphaera giovannonii]|uniref:N,N'-diacetylchitobiose phosphorylase n=1 Tax=Aquisphaera giovannonii TaxID=406548 RepID=A0A5B9WE65_9BACT|nr:glucoamylase family protein [Aquisphaera giovannonii]QEH38872.1 N,N'-diacetylchitobiose phosphorylase [Aquisphaera giovannonii]
MSSSFLEAPAPAGGDAGAGADRDGLRLPDLLDTRPIRAELLGIERLEGRARRLAAVCRLGGPQRQGSPLLKRFVENGEALEVARRRIFGDSGRQQIHGLDADWLADNFPIVDEVLREIRLDMPRGYDAVLPKLGVPPLAGYPRAYALALALVAHTDSELDENRITRFVQAFQEVAPLTIGELWALPTMCRLVLIENLRRLADEMLRRWDERGRADRWCEEVLRGGPAGPPSPGEGRFSRAGSHPAPRPHEAGGGSPEPSRSRDAAIAGDDASPGSTPFERGVGGGASSEPRRSGNSPSARGEATSGLPADGTFTPPFVVRLVQVLRDRGPAAQPAIDRLEAALAAERLDIDEMVGREHHRQAANQITVGNCVLSLRVLSAIDWNLFFERCSAVQKVLRDDPSGVYVRQDFPTSDRYRKAVEKIARQSGADELAVASKANELAASYRGDDPAQGHVGYYLVDRGRAVLEKAFGYRPRGGERLLRATLGHPRLVYFGTIAGLMALALALLGWAAGAGPWSAGGAGGWAWAGLAAVLLAGLLPLSDIVVGLVNHFLTLLLPPRVLPKLEFKDGVPEEFATFVVMPSMLVRPGNAEALCERLETHYLANPTARVRFALLTDFADAPDEVMPNDAALIEDALGRIAALNRRYAGGGPDLFYLFHRRRLYNPAQGCWMGWERKRGKLSEFNRLLRGHRDTTYDVQSGDPSALPRTRFVITLDADTQMPRDTVNRLIGTIAHPLNQPRFDAAAGRVVRGYGLLQPRVSFHLTAATHSRFAGLLASSGGIDPYSTAASDAYMDLFGLGSFTGKGIYDVDAFEAAVGATFPENHILSHDLIEGNFARCGLLSDTELFDDFPARYNAYARREHRWVRGDWQLLPWLGRTVPAPAPGTGVEPAGVADRAQAASPGQPGPAPAPVERRRNVLPAVERWKLLDNLRRSLVPPAVLAMLALGWTVLPGSPWLYTAIAALVLGLPLVKWATAATMGAIRSGRLTPLRAWRESVPSLGGQALLSATFLADQSRLLGDAIVRTLWRLFVSRERLLEWETAASTEARLGARLRDFAVGMWGSPATALALAAAIALLRPSAIWAASPFLLIWLAAPLVAWWVSCSTPAVEEPLSDEARRAFRRVARKIWGFFETFVGEADNWLPPDNFQEVPDGRVAHRTSPTNKGLLLVSTLSAHDLGYLGFLRLAERLERTFDTLERMERHWGHFYNWYETTTLRVLPPAYISTVDSGNFLGCLVALKQGLKDKLREPIVGPALADGLADTFGLVGDDRARLAPGIDALLREAPAGAAAWASWLERFEREASALSDRLAAGREEGEGDEPGSPAHWAGRLRAMAAERRAELDALMAAAGGAGDAAAIPTAGEALGLRDRLLGLIGRAEALAAAMDFRPLYKTERHLYAIGANLAQGRLDVSCYDLMASESCLTSYLTVARGDAPRKHWFQLGRPFIRAAGRTGLLSWGGTMFEYLMPRLLLRSLPGTLMAEAVETAVARQVEYGRQLGIPWGVSESAFAAQYIDGDYRYQSFGVPGLGLKRGLEEDRVVAPYATLMATMIAPREALANLRRLTREGAEGPYGYYEAIDFTPARLSAGQPSAVVKSYMAHHQGMSLVALTNVLRGEVMPRRFHADPTVRAADLLLQERIPPETPIVEPPRAAGHAADAEGEGDGAPAGAGGSLLSRRLTSPFTSGPRTHLLSAGRFHVMITNGGSGYSRCDGRDVVRWRADATCERWGQFFYVRDVGSGAFWSAAHQPTCRPADDYEVVFSADKASFRRRDGEVETLLEVTVSSEQLAEVRRLTVTNHGPAPREVELTSYMEPVLAHPGSDLAHPAFVKLFLETQFVPTSESLICRRRPRAAGEPAHWGVHVMAVDRSAPGCEAVGPVQYETDRARFIGRGRTLAAPAAMGPGAALSGTTGPVLDPAFSLRRRFRIAPGGSAVAGFTLAVAESQDEALALADKYHGISAVARAFELAWAQRQVEHGHGSAASEEAHLFQRLGAHLLFDGATLRGHGQAPPEVASGGGFAALERLGLSIYRPILLLRVAESGELSLLRQLLAAHGFLRARGLESDLVVVNEEQQSGEAEALGGQIEAMAREAVGELANAPGGVFILRRDHLADREAATLEAAARAAFDGARGALAGQLERIDWARALPEPFEASRPVQDRPPMPPPDAGPLLFPNGLGGFSEDGRDYVILAGPTAGQARDAGAGPPLPPAPWVNVIANPSFGFVVSESGSGFTWAGNSQTNRLTPWSNDPVIDPPGEALYVRDELTGEAWCPTPLPIPSDSPTVVRHGPGATTFARNTHGIEHELCLAVPPADPVKLIRLRLGNPGDRPRSLSVTFFAEWVLGPNRTFAAAHVATELDPDTGALLARNAFRQDYSGRVAFADVNRRPRAVTADRAEFLGRHGSPAAPAALGRAGLSGRTGPALDPCAAIQAAVEIPPGESVELTFLLGEADDVEAARALVRRYWEPAEVERAIAAARARWDEILGAARVRTPDPAFDLMMNRWLVYQAVACRLFARSGFYQSGGAFGFRDQLQDVLALLHAAPGLAREQILLAASRQYAEGDVQHWWHPPAGRGVRTRISDDLLWLPFVTSLYIRATGDAAILDAPSPFLVGPELAPGQEDQFQEPAASKESAPLYEHCLRALERGSTRGRHGLPLIGSGDWNDGMNRVGIEGLGESVWLAWFLAVCLREFAGIAESRGDAPRAGRFRERADALVAAAEAHAWDGSWYLRAFTDDGTPLGSASSQDCQIDSIAQSWSVFAGADPARSRAAMQSVLERLVRENDGLILLLTPPFEAGPVEPGYIKGYLPGIRENGAQYTHAATWVVRAFAALGEGDRAADLFRLVNPILHASTPEGTQRYVVEPYVMAGDAYSRPPHVGRGGWTWYTGAAGWLYTTGLESILGIGRSAGSLTIEPCIPASWDRFEVDYRFGSATYHITVENPAGVQRGVAELTLDGHSCEGCKISLIDDGRSHEVRVKLG